MEFLSSPANFNLFLTEKGLIDDIYNSMLKDDTAEAVLTALDVLRRTEKMPIIPKSREAEGASQFFRQLGDQALNDEDYKNAFDLYNQAICCAPKSSNTLLEAFFARAKLYFTKPTCATACLVDINKCLTWDHPSYQTKLKQMKVVVQKRIKATQTPPRNIFVENFFKMGNTHSKVPSASASVGFVVENEKPKVVAEKEIQVGSVVAVEKAYAAHMNEKNEICACHFCHARSLNMIPCDNCRYILFCNERCKTLCWEEYHNVECHIIQIIDLISHLNTVYPLSVRAAIKLKNSCTWDEFICLSRDLGLKEMKSGLVNEVYDVENKASILRCNNEKYFLFGEFYNSIFFYAVIIHYLEGVPSFFPRNLKEKDEAIRAFSRVLMHLFGAFGHITAISNAARNITNEDISSLHNRNHGWFSFTSKLKHSCEPNLYVLGLNNKVALIAMKTIRRGEELTISHVGHYYDTNNLQRDLKLLKLSGVMCRCPVCVNGWNGFNGTNAQMNEQQRRMFEKWNRFRGAVYLGMATDMRSYYNECWNCYNALGDQPNTKENKLIFDEIAREFLLLQYEATKNCSFLDPVKNAVMTLANDNM